ncbi:hypothetical protein H9Q09_10180 [Aurantimonas sp. DM33-3]|uniref:hypothetical protein n=1 Tax=Aurantimonas sp. DM33-3 TaxID=2766955 RepID=UPI0016526F72|nr:hypothetical protein [Aurantimonas sp. DM33-3]MBC6716573.1 hypothetical protein [Aurantimonas sp. DM33-3]
MRQPVVPMSVSSARLELLLEKAVDLYGVRVLDNVDLSALGSTESRARVVASALMERGDARAFVIGRELRASCLF